MSESSNQPQLRKDPITGRVAIIATSRSERPNAFASSTSGTNRCPFCPGNEDQTPAAVFDCSDDTADQAEWSVRVFPNLYPATATNETLGANENAATKDATNWFTEQSNIGRHEVVVETNQHVSRFTELAPTQAENVFLAYAQRFRAWQQESNVRFGIAFKNNGDAAGASIEHTHSQLVGLEYLPKSFEEEWNGASDYFGRHNACVFCEAIKKDFSDHERVVDECDEFVVVCPFASRLPYEMLILPKLHRSHFDRESDDVVRAAGRKTHEMLTRLEKLIENVPYNFLIHSAPFDTPDTAVYHWHVEVIPRIASLAGFEWGTGCHLNPVSPEQAALRLRAV